MKRNYTKAEKEFLRAFVPGHSHREIQEAFNREFDTDLELSQVKSFIKNNKLNTGRTGCFEKGNVPANKGEKMSKQRYEKCKGTMFKKGQLPPNTDPIGTEKLLPDGYLWVKIDNQPKVPKKVNWKQKHRLLWEETHGPIPEGQVLIFLDGDRTHVELDNLALVTRNELARLNQNKLIQQEKELTEAGVSVARLITGIAEAKKRRGNKR